MEFSMSEFLIRPSFQTKTGLFLWYRIRKHSECRRAGRFTRLKSITLHEDYIVGEVNEPDRLSFRFRHEGMIDGKQIHALSFLGSFWGQGEPRFSDEDIVKHSLKVKEVGGAITWDCPVYPSGLIKEPFMKQLISIGKATN
jgi:hypothetical protein